MPPTKRLPGVVFGVTMAFLGFVIGSFIGGIFLVPAGSGLATGAMVLGYGVIGFVGGLFIAIVLVVKLSRPHLMRMMWLALLAAVLANGVLYVRYRARQKARQESQNQPVMVETRPLGWPHDPPKDG